MPVHDLGYRKWAGERMSRLLRPLVVAKAGISLVWRRRWLRMMLIFAWLPIIVFGVMIFMFELASTDQDARQGIAQTLAFAFQRPDLAMGMIEDHGAMRHDVWASLILAFFRMPQLIAMVLLVGLIAPMLISYDLRSKAYLMYFSRPLSPLEYIVGKSAVLWFFLSAITLVPALALYVVAIFMSPDLSVIGQTWDIPLRIIGATLVLVVPTTALALCYSSFTSESRYATFSWFATWAMGFVAYGVLTYSGIRRGPGRGPGRGGRFGGPRGRRGRFNREEFDQASMDQFEIDRFEDFAARQQDFEAVVDLDKWTLVSPFHTLGKVQTWVFGLDASATSVMPAVIVLVVITGACLLIIRHRIVARLSV